MCWNKDDNYPEARCFYFQLKDTGIIYISFFFLFSNKECPTCRKKLVSKRSLRPDPNFDALISKIYPSRDEYEAHQERVLARINKHNNQQALSHSIEEGLKIQAMNRPSVWQKNSRLKMVVEQKIMATVLTVVMHPYVVIRKQDLVTNEPKHLMILDLSLIITIQQW